MSLMKDYVYVNCVGTSDLQNLSRRELNQECKAVLLPFTMP